MKLKIILLLVAISFSCSNQDLQKEEEANRKQLSEKYYEELNKKDEAKRKEINTEYSQEMWKEEIKNLSKEYGFSNLQNDESRADDIEIRIWRFAPFNERNFVFQLSKNNGKWSANLTEKTFSKKESSKKDSLGTISRRKLKEPKSGWENLYKKLLDEEILTLPDGDAVGNEVCPDCRLFVVETKVDGKYRIYDYHSPENDKETRESQQLVKIINVISKEFELNVFDNEKFLQS